MAEYLRLRGEGRLPDREATLHRHPDLATDLARFFAGRDGFASLAACGGGPPVPSRESRG